MSFKSVVVLTGPTGVGKTEISLAIARHFQCEIVNADASQIRRKLNIGTAKIEKEKMGNITHHLFDIVDVNESFSIKDYQDLVRPLLETIKRPLMVGGSGLYIKSALSDYDLSSPPRQDDIYNYLNNQELYNLLQEADSNLASKTHPNNRRRVLRYLELSKNNYKAKEAKDLYRVLVLNLSRSRRNLYDRINSRVLKMIDAGWIKEVEGLRTEKVNFALIDEIGYKELNLYLDGEISLEECINIIQQKTRKYAKRQITWFKHQVNSLIIDLETTSIDNIIKIVEKFYLEEG